MSPGDFYTAQFYAWELRGRGWYLSDRPVHLEAPFMPFFRHGFPNTYVDDGKRHTLLSSLFQAIWPERTVSKEPTSLEYEKIEPFEYEDESKLIGLKLIFPKERKMSIDSMKACLIVLADMPYLITSFEIIGSASDIYIQFVIPEERSSLFQSTLGAHFPGFGVVRVDPMEILRDDCATYVVDCGLRHEFIRPLNITAKASFDPLLPLMALCERLNDAERIGLQILFQPCVNQWPESIRRSVTVADGTSFFIDEPDMPKLAERKTAAPLYGVCVRLFTQTKNLDAAYRLLEQTFHSIFLATQSPYNELLALKSPDYEFETRIEDIISRRSHRLGMLLNVDELTTLVHFPNESCRSDKFYRQKRKTIAAPNIAIGHAYVLGINQHNEQLTKVSLSVEQRFKHLHLIGGTGTGKSTLMTQLVLQDIHARHGVIVFDPHGDLIDDIVSRIPLSRQEDVLVIDPSDTTYSIGFNLLQAHSDIEKELLSSDLVGIFRRFATSWGDQMSSVLGNTILALLENTKPATLHDLRRFLVEPEVRANYVQTITDPTIQYYWQKEYPLIKSGAVGPILTRLDTFLRPKAIRQMLMPEKGIDFTTVLRKKQTVLCKLSQGLLGTENSYILGSLLLAKIHQAILSRQQNNDRDPLFIYIDEFQHFITPSVKEMLSGVRKYAAGLILAHQELQQLQRDDASVSNSLLTNCYSRIMFRVGEQDAKRFQEGCAHFEATDFQNLGRGEAIGRVEQPQFDFTLNTVPLEAVDEETRNERLVSMRASLQFRYPPLQQITSEESVLEVEQVKPKTQVEEKPQSQPISRPKSVSHEQSPPQAESGHRYLQALIKRFAEERGFTATMEATIAGSAGFIDLLIYKDGKRIGIEICHTTEAGWEVQNISKCINAGCDIVISVSGDKKQLAKIEALCGTSLPEFESCPVYFCTPDEVPMYLDAMIIPQTTSKENTMRGYKVNVTYESLGSSERERKQASISKIVLDSLRRQKKKH